MNSISIFRMITGMLSGLTLFIFGMNVMSEALGRQMRQHCRAHSPQSGPDGASGFDGAV
jgi:hypothetical protein